jgi:hypothetical protein
VQKVIVSGRFLWAAKAFEKCMDLAHKKWRWVHKKLA